MSPNGMTVDVSSQSISQLSPLQDPFFYANIVQRVEKSHEFRKSAAQTPMYHEHDNAPYEIASLSDDNDDDDYDSPPHAPKRRMSRNNFATVIQRLSSVAKPNTAKKSVRFQDDSKNLLCMIREIESHKDFSTRERNRCWWSPSEKEKCMSKHERVVSRMEHRKPCRKHETYRGLESWTSQGAAKLDQVINLCVDAVMDEQDHQWRVHKDDFERIAAISQRATADSAKRARHVGLKDEREALLVRNQSWVEDDEMTVQSAMGASVMTAAKRKKKLASLRDKRDPSAKKLSKRMGKSSSSSKEKQHKHSSSSSGTSTALEKHIYKKSSSVSGEKEAGAESVKSSSKKSRSDRSVKSSSKKESSSSSKSRSKSKSGEHERASSSNASVSSSKKKKSSSRSDPSKTAPPTTTTPTARDTKFNSLIVSGTPPTSFSSTSSSLDETSPLAAAIIRQSNHKSQISHNKTKTSSSSNHSIATISSSSHSGGGKCFDPPGRRATRSKSSHADKTLLSMKSQAKAAVQKSAPIS